MNPFESTIQSKIESKSTEETIESLLNEFPEELQEIHEAAIEALDDNQAKADYLFNKLIQRKEALVEWSPEKLAQIVEVSHEVPQAIIDSLEMSKASENKNELGQGKNGDVYSSVSQPHACYKVLKMERVRDLGLSIVREAAFQYQIGTLVNELDDGARVPQVLGFVEHPQVLAMLMEKVEGASIYDILQGKKEIPHNFDIEGFFEKLEKTVVYMNQHGYFHRDFMNYYGINTGNIMIGNDGEPWIIDFGSAIKSINTAENGTTYQLHVTGGQFTANDLAGIVGIKKRLEEFLTNKK